MQGARGHAVWAGSDGRARVLARLTAEFGVLVQVLEFVIDGKVLGPLGGVQFGNFCAGAVVVFASPETQPLRSSSPRSARRC